jgi:hypothetical protein
MSENPSSVLPSIEALDKMSMVSINSTPIILPKPTKKKINKVKQLSNEIMDSLSKLDELKKKLTKSNLQTKEWRKSQTWYFGGKKYECEKYQRELLEELFNMKCPKTNYRLNTRTLELKEITNPLKHLDGFDWTEDFDVFIEDYNLFINLKFVCEQGGAQTRTLREVAHFIDTQLRYLVMNKDTKYKFINILDGDTSSLFMPMFKYKIQHEDFKDILPKIFVGDMVEFVEWFTLK